MLSWKVELADHSQKSNVPVTGRAVPTASARERTMRATMNRSAKTASEGA